MNRARNTFYDTASISHIERSMRQVREELDAFYRDTTESIEAAIQALDCGPLTERTVPDFEAALETLRALQREVLR